MIKSELIANIAQEMTHIPEHQVAEGVNTVIELLSDTLSNNQRIEVRGVGSFTLRHRKPRQAHNPKTGEKLFTSEKYSAHFKPGKTLRERVDAAKAQHPALSDA